MAQESEHPMREGPAPQEAHELLRHLSHRKRLRARLAAAVGIRLYEPDEASAAIAVARRNMRNRLDLWLGPVVFFGIFVPVWISATNELQKDRTLAIAVGIMFLVLYFGFAAVYTRRLWRRAVRRNLETLRRASGSGTSEELDG
jgi:hypothetical protein